MPSHHDSRRRGHDQKPKKTLASKFMSFLAKIAGDPAPPNNSHHGRARQFHNEEELREFLEAGDRYREEKEAKEHHRRRGSTFDHSETPRVGEGQHLRRGSIRGRSNMTDSQDMRFRDNFLTGVDVVTSPFIKPKPANASPQIIKRKPVPAPRKIPITKPENILPRETDWEEFSQDYFPSPRPNKKRRSPRPVPRPGRYVKHRRSRDLSNSIKTGGDSSSIASSSSPKKSIDTTSLTGTTLAGSLESNQIDATFDLSRKGGLQDGKTKVQKVATPLASPARYHKSQKAQVVAAGHNPDAHMTSMSLFIQAEKNKNNPTDDLPPMPGPPPATALPLSPIPAVVAARPREKPGRGRSPLVAPKTSDPAPPSSNKCVSCFRNPKLPGKSQCEACYNLHGGRPSKDAKFRPGSRWQQSSAPPPPIPTNNYHHGRLDSPAPHMPEHRISSATTIEAVTGIGHQDFAPAKGAPFPTGEIARMQKPLGQPTHHFDKRLPEVGYEAMRPPTIPPKDHPVMRRREQSDASGGRDEQGKLLYRYTASTYASSDLSFACRGLVTDEEERTQQKQSSSAFDDDNHRYGDQQQQQQQEQSPISPMSDYHSDQHQHPQQGKAKPVDIREIHPAYRHRYTEDGYLKEEGQEVSPLSDHHQHHLRERTPSFSTTVTAVLPEPKAWIGHNDDRPSKPPRPGKSGPFLPLHRGGGGGGGGKSKPNATKPPSIPPIPALPSLPNASEMSTSSSKAAPPPHPLKTTNRKPVPTPRQSRLLTPSSSSQIQHNHSQNQSSNHNPNASVYALYEDAFLAEAAEKEAERSYLDMLAEQQQHQQSQQHQEGGRSRNNALTAQNLQRYQDESANASESEYEDDLAMGFAGGYNPKWESRIVLPREKREEEERERRRAEEEWEMF